MHGEPLKARAEGGKGLQDLGGGIGEEQHSTAMSGMKLVLTTRRCFRPCSMLKAEAGAGEGGGEATRGEGLRGGNRGQQQHHRTSASLPTNRVMLASG